MTKVIALAVTLIIGVTGVLLVTNGVAWLMPILVKYLFPIHHTQIGRFVPQFVLWVCVAVAIAISQKKGRTETNESEEMTPLVRRSPTTGQREL